MGRGVNQPPMSLRSRQCKGGNYTAIFKLKQKEEKETRGG